MSIQVKAVFEQGVLRPLESIQLRERQEVLLTIDPAAESTAVFADQVRFVLPPDRWQAFCDALDAPPKDIPELRKLLTEASLFDDAGSAASARPA